MATLFFCVVDHIFFICYLNNQMTWFCDFWSKIIGNILKIFLIFKLIFLESSAENIQNATFYFIQICPRFALNHNFCNDTTVWEKSIKALFYPKLKKIISPKLAKLVSRPIHRLKFISLNL
jgi:hypothetical protein